MDSKNEILIIEPSFILREGISELVRTVNTHVIITSVDSLSNSLKVTYEVPFRMVIVNPIILNTSKTSLHRFFTSFEGIIMLGLISTSFNRDLHARFSDYIYLNDDKETIINTIAKHLKAKPDYNISPGNDILSTKCIWL